MILQKECYCRYCEECAAGNCQNQYNRKLDGAEEEINYRTDSACANYLDTCEEKEYYDYNELCGLWKEGVFLSERSITITMSYVVIGKRVLNLIEL